MTNLSEPLKKAARTSRERDGAHAPSLADTYFWKQDVVWAPVGSVAAGTVVEQS